jgi:hypothetical protein
MVKRRRSLSSWALYLLGIVLIALVSGPPIAAYAVASTTTSCISSPSPSEQQSTTTNASTTRTTPSGAAVEQQRDEEDDTFMIGEHNLDKFYIHGWRWHTLALGRDARRLAQLATQLKKQQEDQGETTTNSFSNLKKATDHTVNFNMKGLHRIESEVFFPWVRQKVVQSILFSMNNNDDAAVAITQQQQKRQRLVATMDRLEQYQRRLQELGRALVRE